MKPADLPTNTVELKLRREIAALREDKRQLYEIQRKIADHWAAQVHDLQEKIKNLEKSPQVSR
jgi:hypothetical protein